MGSEEDVYVIECALRHADRSGYDTREAQFALARLSAPKTEPAGAPVGLPTGMTALLEPAGSAKPTLWEGVVECAKAICIGIASGLVVLFVLAFLVLRTAAGLGWRWGWPF